jgi:ribosomal protein S18 acetylase RimI-like enzyme
MLGYMNQLTRYRIRPLVPADQPFLWEMLYQALYVPDGHAPFERSIIEQPRIAQYVGDWGRTDDCGFVAVGRNDMPLGAIWLRLLVGAERGFGYVDEQTPELGMAVLPAYRGQGIGSSLLTRLIALASDSYEQICLSVAAENPALRLYERFGFETVKIDGATLTMRKRLTVGSVE